MNALLSAYEKNGIEQFAQDLVDLGFNLWSSSGTYKYLQSHGLQVRDVADLVGPPILGHKVVTLSREIHAGLLADNSVEEQAELWRLNIPRFDLLCVDLYPLRDAIAQFGYRDTAKVRSQTDIGGPTMIRSAAKGQRIVVCRPQDRAKVIEWLRSGKPHEETMLRRLAAIAEREIAEYCRISWQYLNNHPEDSLV